MRKKYLKIQEGKLRSGQIDRRQFVMSALAAGVVLPTALAMADKVAAATPNQGGLFRIGVGHGSTTDSMDPGTYENGMTGILSHLIGGHLTEVSNQTELIPELAEGWEARADAATWRFKMRQGIEFHDGKTLTADDVIATLNFHRGENSRSAAKGLLSAITDISKDGDTVVIALESGNADFPFIVSDYHLTIMADLGDGTVDPLSAVRTGGYILDSYDPGVRISASRNPNYFKEGRAHFDEVEILSLLDVTARQNALMNGDVDAIDRVDPKTVALLARAPNVNIVENTGYLHYTFPMRVDVAPFDNFDLRMALKLAVKRQEMVDKILLGHGALGNDHPISTAVPFHAASLPQRKFDPDLAKFHYQKSGHSGPIPLSTSDAAFGGADDASQLIAASAAEIGITIDVIREPKDGYWSNVWNKKPWCSCYWGGRPTADWMFSAAYVDSTEWNDTAWRTGEAAEKFNLLVVEARSELDSAKRAELYTEAQRLIRDDGGALIPMFANYIEGLNKSVAHEDTMAANWEMDGHKAAERWWFA